APYRLSTLSLHDALPIYLTDPLQLVGDRQPQDVGGHDAPQRRHEGAGDEVAELAGVAQVLEHVHEAEDGADDAQGRREAAHGVRSEEHTSELQSRENLVW